MKKSFALAVLIIYALGSTGATIDIHYCMNKLVGFSLCSGSDVKCNWCGMEKPDCHGCCHDEHQIIKTVGEHQQPAWVPVGKCLSACAAVMAPIQPFHLATPGRKIICGAVYQSPSGPPRCLYKLHCAYRC